MTMATQEAPLYVFSPHTIISRFRDFYRTESTLTGWEFREDAILFTDSFLGFVVALTPTSRLTWRTDVHCVTYRYEEAVTGEEQNDTMFPLLVAVSLADTPQPVYSIEQEIRSAFCESEAFNVDLFYHLQSCLSSAAYKAIHEYRFQELYRNVPGIKLQHLSQTSNSLWGSWNDYYVYFVYDTMRAELRISTDQDTIHNRSRPDYNYTRWNATVEYEKDIDVVLSDEEMTYLFCLLASRLDSEPFHYKFTLPERCGLPANTYLCGSGRTLEEAQNTCARLNERYFIEGSISCRPSDLIPLEKDERSFTAKPEMLILAIPPLPSTP